MTNWVRLSPNADHVADSPEVYASTFGVATTNTNNGPALQAAIDSLATSTSGKIILPSGLLPFTSGVVVPAYASIPNIVIEGVGTIPYLASGSIDTLFEFQNASGILRNVFIANFGDGTLGSAVYLNGANGFSFEDCAIDGQDGIVTNGVRLVNAFGVQLHNTQIIFCSKGIFADSYSAHQLTLAGCYLGNNAYGIHNDFSSNPIQQLSVADTTTQFNTVADFHLNGAVSPIFYSNELEGDPNVAPSTSITFDFTGTVNNPTFLNNLFAHRTEQFKNISLGDFTNNSLFNQNITFDSTVAGLAVRGSKIISGSGSIVGPAALTVATLPPIAEVSPGTHYFVSNANATTRFSTVAGGGSNKVPVVSDGTNWIIA